MKIISHTYTIYEKLLHSKQFVCFEQEKDLP